MKHFLLYFYYFFLFLLFFAFSASFALPSSSPRWIVVFLFTAMLPFFYLQSAKKKCSVSITIFLLFLFYIWNLLTGFWAVDYAGFAESNLYLTYTLLFFFAIYCFRLEQFPFKAIFRFLLVCLFLHSVLGIAQYFGFDYFYQVAAPAGTFVNKNYATPLIPLLLPYLAYLITTENRTKQQYFYSITFIVTIIYLLIAVTRSSWLSSSIVFVLLAIVFLFSKLRKRILLRFFPLFLILVLFFGIDGRLNKSTKVHRDYRDIESIVKPDAPLQQRLDKWQNGLQMIKENPFLGYGAGNFDANYPLFHDAKVPDSGYSTRYFLGGIHNIFLQIFIEIGLVGFFILLLFWLRLIFLSYYKYRSSGNIIILLLLIGLFGFLVDCFWNNTYQHPVFAIIVALFTLYLIKESDARKILTFSIPKSVFLAFYCLFFLFTLYLSSLFVSSEIAMKKALLSESAGHPYSAWKSMNKAMENWKWHSQNHYIASRIGYNYFISNQTQHNWQLVHQRNEETLQVLPYHYLPNFISLLLEMHLPNPDFSKKNIDLFLAVSPASKKGDSYEMIATVFEKNNKLEKAIAFYEKAQEFKPHEKRISYKIEFLQKQIKDEEEK